ncbi:hypothetical protein FRC10_009414 [Ceratobasidium sp. 414]|nr:hypothetical protein FRC10_009414 [Ceratobasidium sp. 414]
MPSFTITSPYKPSKLSKLFNPHLANDWFAISTGNNLVALCGLQDFNTYEEILFRKVDNQKLSFEQIIVLTCTVSTHQPNYILASNQCYWYAGTVWKITCALDDTTKPIEFSPVRGTNMLILWVKVKPTVFKDDMSEALCPEYDQAWKVFNKDVEKCKAERKASEAQKENEILVKELAIAWQMIDILKSKSPILAILKILWNASLRLTTYIWSYYAAEDFPEELLWWGISLTSGLLK